MRSSEVASVLGGMSISAEGESNFKTGDGSISVAYMRFPAFMAQVFAVDTPWVSVDAAKVFNDETLSQLNGQADPTAYIQMLAYASDDVAKVGAEDVRGEPTTHYHATVDLGRLAEHEKNEMPRTLSAGLRITRSCRASSARSSRCSATSTPTPMCGSTARTACAR